MKEDTKDLKEALSLIDTNIWQEKINDEMVSLESNRTCNEGIRTLCNGRI